jgi:hypothetical protein
MWEYGMTRLLRTALLAAFAICMLQVWAYAAPPEGGTTRLLTGQVMGHGDAPLPGAMVYLKNTKSLTVKTYITSDTGNYRFPALTPNADYEIYAEYKGKRSDTKTLSSFDSRQHATINLKIDTAK